MSVYGRLLLATPCASTHGRVVWVCVCVSECDFGICVWKIEIETTSAHCSRLCSKFSQLYIVQLHSSKWFLLWYKYTNNPHIEANVWMEESCALTCSCVCCLSHCVMRMENSLQDCVCKYNPCSGISVLIGIYFQFIAISAPASASAEASNQMTNSDCSGNGGDSTEDSTNTSNNEMQ